MRLDTCRASPQVVAAGGMASSGAREPVEDPASKVLITSSVADQNLIAVTPTSRRSSRVRPQILGPRWVGERIRATGFELGDVS